MCFYNAVFISHGSVLSLCVQYNKEAIHEEPRKTLNLGVTSMIITNNNNKSQLFHVKITTARRCQTINSCRWAASATLNRSEKKFHANCTSLPLLTEVAHHFAVRLLGSHTTGFTLFNMQRWLHVLIIWKAPRALGTSLSIFFNWTLHQWTSIWNLL